MEFESQQEVMNRGDAVNFEGFGIDFREDDQSPQKAAKRVAKLQADFEKLMLGTD